MFEISSMIFNKHLRKYWFRYFLFYLFGVIALIVVDLVQTRIPYFLGQIVDNVDLLANDTNELWKMLRYIIIYAFVMAAGRVIWRLTIFRASTGVEANLRKDMFEKAERLPTAYYHETKVGAVMSWFTNDIETIGEYFGWGTIMLVDAFFLSIIVIIQMIMNVDLVLTLIALVPILLIVIWGALVEKYMSLKWEERQKAYDDLYDFAQENFTGIRVIKAFVKENKEIHAFAKVARRNKDVNINFARISILFDVLIELIISIEIGCILGFGGWFVYSFATGTPIVIAGHEIKMTIGMLMTFVGYIDILIWPMIALGQIVTMRSRAKTSLKRISNFLDTEEVIKNAEDAIILENVKGKITFKNFSFSYPNNEYDSLKEISLTINPGEKIGIVGKIGCGKTTLVNSLLRLYNVNEGQIFIDDIDLMKCDLTSLRDSIAYVPQDNFLFSDKVKNNIAFSTEDVDEEKVIEAAKFADVHDNIVEFTEGYDTISGERGVTLSGGQKQRIAIARAYYKHAPIMILDDSVSAVDVKTEETILKNINEKRQGMTTLVVASRVSTIKHLDKIIVLKDGQLEAFGSHDELMKTSEAYQRMVYLQELEAEVEGLK